MKVTVHIADMTFEVSGHYTPGDPGRTSGPPENCYPPEPSEFEVESIIVDGIDLLALPIDVLNEDLIDKVEAAAAEAADAIDYSEEPDIDDE